IWLHAGFFREPAIPYKLRIALCLAFAALLQALEHSPTRYFGKAGYGLGYATEMLSPANLTVQGHIGRYPGSFTFWYYLPAKDTFVIFNRNSAGTTPDNLRIIRTAVLAHVNNGTVTGRI
ncbi:MAG: hypothetical protein Q7T80_00030, partial [Methanoregula sp.]|nr:hypothetical protein [Methanoregula sp.]